MENLEIVELLLQNNANPDLADESGRLPYQCALLNMRTGCFKLILSRMKTQPNYKIETFTPSEFALIKNITLNPDYRKHHGFFSNKRPI
jgi:hypothetical protein